MLGAVGKRLTPYRYRHSVAVADTAVNLARRHGVDTERAWVAGLVHDYARELPPEELLRLARQHGLEDLVAEPSVALLHAPLGAILLVREVDIHDEGILQAVSRHTTGAPAMTALDMVVYLADLIEPGRRFPGVDELRLKAREDLAEAVRMSLRRTLAWLVASGRPVDPRTVDALNWFEGLQRA